MDMEHYFIKVIYGANRLFVRYKKGDCKRKEKKK